MASENQQKPSEPPLFGRWHHGSGQLVCGTVRVASETFDTDPCDEFKAEMFDWMCDTLNQSVELYHTTGKTPRELAGEVAILEVRVKVLEAEMSRYLPLLEWLEGKPSLWEMATEVTGIATANGYRHALLAKHAGEPGGTDDDEETDDDLYCDRDSAMKGATE